MMILFNCWDRFDLRDEMGKVIITALREMHFVSHPLEAHPRHLWVADAGEFASSCPESKNCWLHALTLPLQERVQSF